MARRRSFQSRGKTIDFKSWLGIPGLRRENAAVGTFLGGAISFDGPATILRVRGDLTVAMDETKQAGDVVVGAAAVGIVSTDAFTAGSTPDPHAEPEYPWLWWRAFYLEAFVAAAEEALGSTVHRMSIDTKAMRKVKPGESVFFVYDIITSTGAPVVILNQGELRVLIGT